MDKHYPSFVRKLWRGWLRLRCRLIQRGRYDRLVLENVAGQPILVLPRVFNPKLLRTGEFMARQLDKGLIPENAKVLDLGCGSGIGAVTAAKWTEHVVAADINPHAVRCTRINALLNHVEERIEAKESDLFSALEKKRFDVVLFNPPFYRGEAKEPLDHAWKATDTLERFAEQLPDHLEEGGCALVVFSSDGDVEGLLAALGSKSLRVEVLEEHDLINEILILYRVECP
jgi:release factor glutamine methyltransferase